MFYDQDIEYDAQCVMEAVLEKKSLDKMLSTYLKQLDSKLKTVEDCDEFLEKIKVDASRFNDNLRTLQDSKAKYEKGTIDYKEYKTISRKASREVASSCRTFKINLSRFGGKGAEDITKEDIHTEDKPKEDKDIHKEDINTENEVNENKVNNFKRAVSSIGFRKIKVYRF